MAEEGSSCSIQLTIQGYAMYDIFAKQLGWNNENRIFKLLVIKFSVLKLM